MLGSVIRAGIGSLTAMLSSTSANQTSKRLPWVELVLQDMMDLREFHGSKLETLGDPATNAKEWMALIHDFPHYWSQMVSSYTKACTHMDQVARGTGRMLVNGPNLYRCSDCAMAGLDCCFVSEKGLLAHKRKVHGHRSSLRRFLDASGICPICCCIFSSRTRALAHLTEKRNRSKTNRTSCRDVLLAGNFCPLLDETVEKLDLSDKIARAQARKRGHTQPIAGFFAKRTTCGAPPNVQSTYSPLKRLLRKTRPHEVAFVCKKPRLQ